MSGYTESDEDDGYQAVPVVQFVVVGLVMWAAIFVVAWVARQLG